MLYKLGLFLGRSYYANQSKAYDEGDIEVYAYGFEMFWENILALIFFQVVGIIIGLGFETLFFLLAFLSIRRNAGGYHAKTSGRCFLSSSLIYAVFLLLIFLIPYWSIGYVALLCVGLSVAPIIKLAPFRDKGTPLGERLTKVFRKRVRVIFAVQAFVILGLSGVVLASSFIEFPIYDIVISSTLSIALGQFTAAFSLVLAKVTKQGI